MKNKNLTFEKNFTTVWDLDSEIVIDISAENYIITRPTGENRAYLTGPAVDRLHEFEKLNMEPKELERVMENHREHVAQLRGEIARLEAELEANKKEQVDIHKLIDEVREKKDCYVHILIGDNYTSVDVRPDEPGLQRWIVANDGWLICPNCGRQENVPHNYCPCCGEQLGKPVREVEE